MPWQTENDDDEKVVSIKTGKKEEERRASSIIYFRSTRTQKWDTKRLDTYCNFRIPESMSRYISEFVEHRVDKVLNTKSDVFRDALEQWIFTSRRVDEDAITKNARKAAVSMEAEQTLINMKNVEKTIGDIEQIIQLGPANYPKARELIERSLEVEDHPVLIKKFNSLLQLMTLMEERGF